MEWRYGQNSWAGVSSLLKPGQLLLAGGAMYALTFLLASGTSAANENPVPDLPSADQLQLFLDAPEQLYPNPVRYRILRNRKPIGLHSVSFEHSNNELTVNVDSEMTLKRLGLTFYSHRYSTKEVWSGGELVLLSTVIDEKGKATRSINATSRGDYLHISDSSEAAGFTTALPDYGSNHWHPGAVVARRIFHVLHGRVYQGPPTAKGWERVVLENGEVVSARRYKYTTGFNADVWYDADWRWIKLTFLADDGSEIEYKCIDSRI